MEYRYLENTGLRVSVLSYGSWKTFRVDREKEAYECMTAARDLGVNYFDTAEQYEGGQSEIIMGNILKSWFDKKECRRSDIVISTKIFWDIEEPVPSYSVNRTGLSRKHIIEGMKRSLERLQLDYVDIVYCHRYDPHSSIEEIARSMNYLIDKGYAFYWGTSKWPVEKIVEITQFCKEHNLMGPCVEQNRYNWIARNDIENTYKSIFLPPYSMGLSVYGPLAGGILTGKYLNGINNGRFNDTHNEDIKKRLENGQYGCDIEGLENMNRLLSRLIPISEKLHISLATLAMIWILKNPCVTTVTFGATTKDQVYDNIRCLESISLVTDDVMAAINKILDEF